MGPRLLFGVATLALLSDAVGYTLGAIRPIQQGLAPADDYWRKRLLLNLMLAAHGLYVTAAACGLATYFVASQPAASQALALLSLISSLYSVVTVPWLTPKDSVHIIPRAVSSVALLAGLATMRG